MNIRIPVSLKFDTDTDFYNDFIYDMRENRTLSDFIVSTLKAYYENESVRELLNTVLEMYDPLTEAKKHIQRAQLEHTKVMMSTSMLEQHLNKAKTNFEQNGSVVDQMNPQAQQSLQQTQHMLEAGSPFNERLESLEKSIPSIDKKLELLMSIMQQQAVAQTLSPILTTQAEFNQTVQEPIKTVETVKPSTNPPTQPLVEVEQGITIQTQPEFSAPINQQPTILPPVEQSQPVFQPQQEQPQFQSPPVVTMEAPTIQVDAPSIIIGGSDETTTAVEEVKAKPSSFGKAFNSIKKK